MPIAESCASAYQSVSSGSRGGKIEIDPDRRVQDALRTVFRLFERLGRRSCSAIISTRTRSSSKSRKRSRARAPAPDEVRRPSRSQQCTLDYLAQHLFAPAASLAEAPAVGAGMQTF